MMPKTNNNPADLLTMANTSRPAADAGRAGRHHEHITNKEKD
jgi:hypothetical protein